MSNPAGDDAANAIGTNKAFATTKQADANAANANLFPFLNSEITNPPGFGDDTVSKMKTEGGESVASGLGQATEAAQLFGSRTGNTASTPGIIDAASRNAMKANSDNALGVDIANAKAKLGQQQAGAAGLSGQYNADTQAALSAMGLTNQAVGIENGAYGNSFTGQFMGDLADNVSGKTAIQAAGRGGFG